MSTTQTAAIAMIAAAVIHAIGGVVSQVVQASTLVGDDRFSYPWTSAELVAVSLSAAVAWALGCAGLAGVRASGVAAVSVSRAGRGVVSSS